MKLVLALAIILSSFMAVAAETPSIGTSIDENNLITLTVSNNDNVELKCRYTVSWLVNILTYRRQFGDMDLPVAGSSSVSFKNDKYDHITRVHASVHCE